MLRDKLHNNLISAGQRVWLRAIPGKIGYSPMSRGPANLCFQVIADLTLPIPRGYHAAWQDTMCIPINRDGCRRAGFDPKPPKVGP